MSAVVERVLWSNHSYTALILTPLAIKILAFMMNKKDMGFVVRAKNKNFCLKSLSHQLLNIFPFVCK